MCLNPKQHKDFRKRFTIDGVMRFWKRRRSHCARARLTASKELLCTQFVIVFAGRRLNRELETSSVNLSTQNFIKMGGWLMVEMQCPGRRLKRDENSVFSAKIYVIFKIIVGILKFINTHDFNNEIIIFVDSKIAIQSISNPYKYEVSASDEVYLYVVLATNPSI